MFNVKLQNSRGDILEFGYQKPFRITEIQGLNPPGATINTSEIALLDGAKFNSSKVNMRQILMTFIIDYDVGKNRIEMYRVIKSKQAVRFYYKDDQRDVYIDGYVESVDIAYFEIKQSVTVSILCPSPFFREAQEIINSIDSTINSFVFPFAIAKTERVPISYIDMLTSITINNLSDVECGMIIEVYAKGRVINPKIYNYISGEYIGIDFVMQTGDSAYINTNRGEKTITLLRAGKYSSIFNTVMQGSKWLQLQADENTFVHEAVEGKENMNVIFTHKNMYEGV